VQVAYLDCDLKRHIKEKRIPLVWTSMKEVKNKENIKTGIGNRSMK